MATVLNLLDLKERISERNSDGRDAIDTSVNTLILLSVEQLGSTSPTDFKISMNKDPEVICCFRVYVHNKYYASINIHSERNVPDNFNCELSLYYIDALMKLNIVEVLNLENITEKSTFNLMHPLQIFHFVSTSSIPTAYHEKLVNNHLCLYCHIRRKDTVIPLNVKIPENEMSQQFLALYENKELTDFKIICKDGQEFFVHKLVLAARSPVFKAMFGHDFQESRKNKVEIIDFQPEIVAQMLRFIYTDNIEDFKEEMNAEALLAIADQYGLQKLKLLCFNEMSKTVNTISDALDTFSIAENYHVAEFKEIALEFIKNNRHTL